jgi:hypothetical protein
LLREANKIREEADKKADDYYLWKIIIKEIKQAK